MRAWALLALLGAACASSSVGGDDGGGPSGDGGDGVDALPGTPDAMPGVEVCDGLDNDGDQFVDEGGAELCPVVDNAMPSCNGFGGCRIESCGMGFVDVDNLYSNGCECAQEAGELNDAACEGARDLGAIPDNGAVMEVTGNLAPIDDSDFFRFQGIDNPDGSCDAYHVRVFVKDDTNAEFVIDAWRGGCAGTQFCTASTDFSWYVNFMDGSIAPPIGQCPCTDPAAAPSATVNQCSDDSSEYIVRVARAPGKPLSCTSYKLEISNGLYPPP